MSIKLYLKIYLLSSSKDNCVKFTPQDHKNAVKVEKFVKEDGKLDFSLTSKEIVNRVRALGEELGCYFFINDDIIKTSKVQDVSNEFKVTEKEILNNKKRFIIGCENGAVEILSCKAPSGKMISGRDYINGHNEILGKFVN